MLKHFKITAIALLCCGANLAWADTTTSNSTTAASTTTTATTATSASQTTPSSNTDLTLGTIVVTGSVNKNGAIRFFAPNSTQVVTSQQINQDGAQQLDAALRYIAGAQAQTYGADLDDSLWFKLRGFDAKVYVDGSSIYQSGYTWYSPDLFGYEQVEVAKGANATIFGTTPAGGAVNLITKRPSPKGGSLVKFNWGNDGQRGVAADVQQALSTNTYARLVANYWHKDGETNGTWGENFYLAPSLLWQIDEQSSLTFLASVQKGVGTPSTNFYPANGTVVFPTGVSKINPHLNLGNPDNDYYRRLAYTLGLEYNRKIGTWDLDLSYHFIQSEREQLASYYSYTLSNTTYARGWLYNNTTSQNHTLDARLSRKDRFVGGNNRLAVGASYNYNKVTGNYGFGSYSGAYNFSNPSYGYTALNTSSLPIYQVNQHQGSAYLQDTLYWNNLTVDLGLRYDAYSDQSDTSGVKAKSNVHRTSYSVGLMYDLPYGISPFVHYSTSFTPLAGSDGVAAYKPITSTQIEYGIKFAPEGTNAKFALTLFNLKEKNSLIYTATVAKQIGNNSAKGVELSGEWNITPELKTYLAYTYLDAKTTTANAKVVRTPLTSFNQVAAKVSYDFNNLTNIPVTLGLGVRYVGSSTDQIGNATISNFKVPGATVYDLSLQYAFHKNWDLLLTATNLTDKEYVTGCYYSCYFGEGRKVNATVSYKW